MDELLGVEEGMHDVGPERSVCCDSLCADAVLRGEFVDPRERRRPFNSRRLAAEHFDEEPLDSLLTGQVAAFRHEPLGSLCGEVLHERAVHQHERLGRHVRFVAAALRRLRAGRIERREKWIGLVADNADIEGPP